MTLPSRYLLPALLGNLVVVEVELSTLKDVAIGSAALAWPGGDAGKETALVELGDKVSSEDTLLLELVPPSLDLLGNVGWLLELALADATAVLPLVPGLEWSGIDGNDGTLSQSVGPDELVIGWVVDGGKDPGLPGGVLGCPGESAGFETEGTVLKATTADTDWGDALFADTGLSSWPADSVVTLATPGDGTGARL